MNNYVIFTDSAADLTPQQVKETGVQIMPMTFFINGKNYEHYPDERAMSSHDYYELLRAGNVGSTAAINTATLTSYLEPPLQAGKDVLYLCFSSALSSTYNTSVQVAQVLAKKYPDRKIYTVDTRCASVGQGLLVYLTAREGMAKELDATSLRDYALATLPHLCHNFTVDDLQFLRRGGRVSATTALVGAALSIKPLLHTDLEGHLTPLGKTRGRHNSLKWLVDRMEQLAIEPQDQIVCVGHGDCEEDAQKVADMVRERMGVRDVRVSYIGPIIGTHSGPGTVALFFLGKER